MTSKRTASSKRAALPRASDHARQFAKDWARLSASGRHDMTRLKQAMLLLIANEQPLGPEWLDHALKGEWADHRECHIGGDFLLIYQLQGDDKRETVIFVRAGSHAELFE
jgi:mRNA interferase YafQ